MTEKTPVQEAIRKFEYCLQCLALELPEPVFKDVQARWREFKDALRTLQSGKGEPVNSDKVDVELAQAYAELYEHAVECEIMSFEGSDRFGDIADRIATLGLLRSGV